MASIGVLLPRDFLDRQPKRWQKSQRKRGALKTLKKMQEKRAKLEHRTLQEARNDDKARWVETNPAQPKIGSSQALVPATPTHAKPAAAASSCTAIGHREQGFWAAQLVPNRPLVVRIPEGAELWLLQAALPEGASVAAGLRDLVDGERLELVRLRVPHVDDYRSLHAQRLWQRAAGYHGRGRARQHEERSEHSRGGGNKKEVISGNQENYSYLILSSVCSA